jgi:hypothetical protein
MVSKHLSTTEFLENIRKIYLGRLDIFMTLLYNLTIPVQIIELPIPLSPPQKKRKTSPHQKKKEFHVSFSWTTLLQDNVTIYNRSQNNGPIWLK